MFTRAAIFSACARLLTNTSVVFDARMWLSTSGATAGQMLPPTFPRSATGDSTAISISFVIPQSTIVTGRNAGRLIGALRHSRRGIARLPRAVAASPKVRCAAADVSTSCFESFQRQRQMRTALGSGDRVDLVDDHRADAAEHSAPLQRSSA